MNLTENAARLIPYRVNKKYLLNILMSKLLQEQFFEKTKQVGQPKLALARLKSAVIPVPSIAEQKRIVDKIEELISELSEQYTIAIVTHSMQQAARVSDRTAYFHLGDLIEVNSTEKVFTQPDHQLTEAYITGRFG